MEAVPLARLQQLKLKEFLSSRIHTLFKEKWI